MTSIDVEWHASAPYPPPGWDVWVVGEHDEDDPMVVARRGSDEIMWSQIDGHARLLARPGVVGASRKPPGGTRRPPFWESVDPCVTETLRLYALGLRRPVTEEGER